MPKGDYPPGRYRPQADRYWEKVQQSDECWLWTGLTDKDGYGVIMWDHRNARTHRVAWQIANGPIPPGISVLHRCDNPPCVRPTHLFLGTTAVNNADKAAKGRAPRQRKELCGTAKLTDSEAIEIRRLYESGRGKNGKYNIGALSQRAIGERFGISQTEVGRIVRGIRWLP